MASGKGTILMTGTTGGLGRAIVSKIISTNELAAYYGIYTARKAESASTLRSTLRSAPATHHYDIESLDLSQLASVRAFANSINSRVADGQLLPIRTLLLTAGCNDMGKQSFTEDGFDMVFAANYLGHWLLALMLLQSMDRENGRIVIVGSATHE
jgi:NAD(P)-dependent dehydrogenase (short-subunit alcohol dehydrogenase family)